MAKMGELRSLGWLLLALGGLFLLLGGLVLLAGRLPFLGRLPGDIRIEREGFTFYFPLVTCLLLSLLLTVLANVILWLWRK